MACPPPTIRSRHPQRPREQPRTRPSSPRTALAPHLTRLHGDTPGVLLLCSDGLWNYAPAAEDLTRIVRKHLAAANGSTVAAARSLVEFARAAGGADNITVALLPVDASPPDQQGTAR